MLKEFGYAVRTDNITSFPNNINSNSGSIIDYSISGDMVQKSENLWNENYTGISSTIKYVPIYVGDGVFTMSSTTPISTGSAATLFFLSGNVSSGASTATNGVYLNNPKTISSTDGYVTVAFRTYTTDTPVGQQTMLSKGLTSLPYVPYNPTPTYPITPIEVGDKTDNLFDKNTTTVYNAYFNQNGDWLASDDSRSVLIPVKPNTTYTLSVGQSLPIFRIYRTNVSTPTVGSTRFTAVIRGENLDNYTFTTKEDTTYIVFQGSMSAVDIWLNSLMFNLGSNIIPYEPYGYKININTNNIYLNEPLYGIGDYKDTIDVTNKTLTRKIKKLVLTGQEDWTLRAEFQGANAYALRLSDLTVTYTVAECVCSHYKFLASFADVSDHIYQYVATAGFISITDTTNLTLSNFKTYLTNQYTNGTPVIVYYVLATPTTENITIPSTLTNNIEGYLTQTGTPTPTNPIYPTYNGTLNKNNTYTITTNIGTDNIIYTSEPIRKIGNYSDVINSDGSISRVIGKYECKGTERWDYTTNAQNRVRVYTTAISATALLPNAEFICSHYPRDTVAPSYPEINKCIINTVGTFIIGINSTEFVDAEAFKTFLQQQYNNGTPVTVWYAVNTPTTDTTITTPPTINTIKGINTINNNNTLSPSNIRLKYNKGDWLETYYRQLDINNITSNTLPMYFNSDSNTIGSYNIKGDMNQNVDFINVLLSEPLNGLDTYKDTIDLSNGNVTRQIKKLVLTGGDDENWSEVALGTNDYIYRIELSDLPKSDFAPICTHYTGSTSTRWVDVANYEITMSISNSLAIHHSGLTGVSDWKSYLQAQYQNGTPVTVWYVLTTPTTETITVPTGLSGTIEGYTIQEGTPTPTNPIYPKSNGELVTNTLTTFPTEIDTYYGNKLTANIKGNMNQSGTPSPSSPITPSECGDMTGNLLCANTTETKTQGYNTFTTTKGSSEFILSRNATENDTSFTIPTSITLPAGTYTASVYGLTNRHSRSLDRIALKDSNGNYFQNNILVDEPKTFTLTEETTIVSILGVCAAVAEYDNQKVRFMLNIGSTALPYEPYGIKIPISSANTTTNVYLGEVQTTRKIKKYEFTGQETDLRIAAAITATNAIQIPTTLSDYKREPFICSHMTVTGNSSGSATHGYYGQSLTICFAFDMGLDTLEKARTYLQQQYAAGTPVTVWYALATETTGIVNEPLRKIRDYADSVIATDIPTITGNQTFDVNTTLKPSEVNLTYNSITTSYYETPTPPNPIYPNECGDIITTGDYSGYYKIPIELNNIYINNPLCAIGTYKDSLDLSTGIVTRNIKKVVLTGDETDWVLNVTINAGNGFYSPGSTPNYQANTFVGVCSHYNTVAAYRDVEEGVYFGGNINYITKFSDGLDDITKWKAYLRQQYNAGTPVTTYYILTTPTTETTTIPYTLTGTIDGYLIQDGTPTPSNPIYPISNGTETKNLFDTNDLITGVLNTDGTVNTSNKKYSTTTYINIKSSIDYTISLISTYSGGSRLIGVCTYDVNKTFISDYRSSAFKNGYKSYTITTDNNAKYIRISVLLGEFVEKDKDIFLIEGSIPSEHYEPYGYKLPAYTTNIYTKEPIRKIGNYSDIINSDGTVTRNIYEMILKGNETIYSANGQFYMDTIIPDYTRAQDVNLALCSHYPTYPQTNLITNVPDYYVSFSYATSTQRLYMCDSSYNGDVTTFKAWLTNQYNNGTPIKVWYVLAEPQIETITNPNLPLLIDENTLDINTKLKPSEITIGAKQWVNKVPKIYINNKWTYNWTAFRELVRSGKAQDVFPVGTILYDTWGDDTSTAFQIVSYNTHYNTNLYNEGYTNSVTLCEEKVRYGVPFDSVEAMMYVTTAMPAGGYKFTIPNYDTTYGGNKTYYFETTQEVPVGGQICLEWRYQTVPRTIRTYASNTSTTVLDSYGTASSPLPEWDSTTYPDAIDLGTVTLSTTTTTGTYGIFNHIHRARYGSNNYLQSKIRQYMNGTTNWWTPQTIFDRPTDWSVITLPTDGLLNILNTDLTNILTTPTITTTTNNTFEYQSLDGTTFTLNSSYTINTDKLFLLSHTEVNLSANPNSGTVLDYYINANDDKRIKYDITDASTTRYWWFRTPYPSYAYHVRDSSASGALSYNRVSNGGGCVPACVIQ